MAWQSSVALRRQQAYQSQGDNLSPKLFSIQLSVYSYVITCDISSFDLLCDIQHGFNKHEMRNIANLCFDLLTLFHRDSTAHGQTSDQLNFTIVDQVLLWAVLSVSYKSNCTMG